MNSLARSRASASAERPVLPITRRARWLAAWRNRSAQLRRDASRWGWLATGHREVMERIREYLGLRLYGVHLRHLQHHNVVPFGMKLRVLSLVDLRIAEKNPELDLCASVFVPALARGDYCVGAFAEERLVAYVWRSFTATPAEDGFWFEPPAGYRYGYKAFTLPAYRGRALHSAVSYFSDRVCLAKGIRFDVSYIETHNLASVRSAKHRNNQRHGFLLTWMWGDRRWAWRSPKAKRLGVKFYFPDQPLMARQSRL